jgi:hypothetical protein
LGILISMCTYCSQVDGITCDGGKPNRKMWEEFGIRGNYPGVINAVAHPMNSINVDGVERKLYFFSDYVHLLKCTRNNLLKREVFEV